MQPADRKPAVRNGTPTEKREKFAQPQSSRVGFLTKTEADAEAADGWTLVRHHRRPDLSSATTAIATVTSPILHMLNGEVTLGDLHVPHLSTRVGRRVVATREGHGQPYITVTTSRASRAGIHPADLPAVSVDHLRQKVHPDLRYRGLPTIQTLKKIAKPFVDAMQFVKAHNKLAINETTKHTAPYTPGPDGITF